LIVSALSRAFSIRPVEKNFVHVKNRRCARCALTNAVAGAARATIATTTGDTQETTDYQAFLSCHGNHAIAAKYSRAEKFRAMICAVDDRATPRARVVIVHLPSRRFGLFQRVL